MTVIEVNDEFLRPNEVLENSLAGGVREGFKSETQEFEYEIVEPKKQSILKVKETDHAIVKVLKKYARFIGPGLMISVAYMDPGNYSTAVSAGATSRFSLLFIVLLSNIIAIFLQSLCIKLGSTTGLDLSRSCREYLPKWLNLIIWFFAECAIIATDVAEVVGTAIALNILIKVPLAAGICITIVDVLFVLMAYRPGSSLKFVRLFEYGVAVLVFGVVICFCVELGLMPPVPVRQVFRGFAPSKEMMEGQGMYIASSILGATVMPHSLFLGSGLVQPRLREYDLENENIRLEDYKKTDGEGQGESEVEDEEDIYFKYKPTSMAIKYAYKYSVAELAITLFTFALFVNSAILIVAGSSLYNTPDAADADLYSIYDLLGQQVAPVAGTIFMIALLFSGQSAGIVCTIAGQIVSEGHLNWTIKPWKRRIATRAISIIPCLIISLSVGRDGLAQALNASQVVLSILLPFLTAPLIYFTCKKSIMRVKTGSEDSEEYLDMTNNWATTAIGVAVWLFISVLNVYMLVKLGLDGS